MPGKSLQPEGEGRVTTGEVRPRGHLCGQSGAQALPLEDGSPFPCLSLCRQLREHTQGAPRAGGGAGNCFCATHPGLLPEAASLPGTAEAPGSAIRGALPAQRGPVGDGLRCLLLTLPRTPPALFLALSETYPSVALAALRRLWT